MSILCTYSIGGKVLDGIYNTLLYGNYVGQAKSKMLERAWRNPGDITDIPRIEIGKSYIVTDNSLIDASYFAIKKYCFRIFSAFKVDEIYRIRFCTPDCNGR